jgi:hypothetical protein
MPEMIDGLMDGLTFFWRLLGSFCSVDQFLILSESKCFQFVPSSSPYPGFPWWSSRYVAKEKVLLIVHAR